MQLLFHGMYERAKVDGSIRTDMDKSKQTHGGSHKGNPP